MYSVEYHHLPKCHAIFLLNMLSLTSSMTNEQCVGYVDSQFDTTILHRPQVISIECETASLEFHTLTTRMQQILHMWITPGSVQGYGFCC